MQSSPHPAFFRGLAAQICSSKRTFLSIVFLDVASMTARSSFSKVFHPCVSQAATSAFPGSRVTSFTMRSPRKPPINVGSPSVARVSRRPAGFDDSGWGRP